MDGLAMRRLGPCVECHCLFFIRMGQTASHPASAPGAGIGFADSFRIGRRRWRIAWNVSVSSQNSTLELYFAESIIFDVTKHRSSLDFNVKRSAPRRGPLSFFWF